MTKKEATLKRKMIWQSYMALLSAMKLTILH